MQDPGDQDVAGSQSEERVFVQNHVLRAGSGRRHATSPSRRAGSASTAPACLGLGAEPDISLSTTKVRAVPSGPSSSAGGCTAKSPTHCPTVVPFSPPTP